MSIAATADEQLEGRSRPQPIRAREQARLLGVSEAELVASSGEAVRLRPAWRELLPRLPEVGRVMCLTRNEHAVHERHGRFEDVSVSGPHGLVLGPDIDLRLFLGMWLYGFAVTQDLPSGRRRSLQFFDRYGTAIHKIYATKETDMAAFEALVDAFRDDGKSTELSIDKPEPRKTDRPDDDIDLAGLRRTWRTMRDTHDFVRILSTYKVGRVQALRLVGDDLARAVPATSLRTVLGAAAAQELPIMCFVGSPGCVQIHTGPVRRLEPRGPWFNVLDPTFNLHLREDAIAHSYVVRKPTDDGIVTSLELFDTAGDTIALFFGARKPGKPELEAWRGLVEAQA
jgi:putative hemin transport protein